jgi:hypothetical protein
MSITTAVDGRDLIRTLLELTGHEYCKSVTGVTVTARMHDVVTVTVEMLAIKPVDQDVD